MANRAEGIADVYINDQQATQSLKQLEDKAAKLNNQLNLTRKANDKLGFDKTQKELKAVEKEMNQYKKSSFEVGKVLDNLSGTSYNNLVKAQRQLRKEIKGMARETKAEQAAYKSKAKQLAAVDGELTKVQKDMKYANNTGIGFRGTLESMGVPMHQFNKLTEIQAGLQGKLTKATQGSSKAMKILRVALISTGIGAIAVAVGSLAAAMFSTQRGTDALNRVLIPLRTIMQRVWGIVQELGTGIMDAFTNPKQAISDLWEFMKSQVVNRIAGIKDTFISLGGIIQSALKFDWDGVKENAKDFGNAYLQTMTGVENVAGKVAAGIQGLAGDIKTAAQEGQRLAEIKVQLEELAITRARDEARLNRIFEQQRTVLNDVNASESERLRAGQAAIAASEEVKNLKLQELELQIEEQEILMKQNDSDREAKLELAKLQAERDTLEAAHIKETLKIKKRINSLSKTALEETRKELEALANFEQETVDLIAKELQEELKNMDFTIEPDINFDEEETDENLQGFVDKYNAAQDMISQYQEESTWERLEEERQAIENARQQNLISEAQYQKALNDINVRGIQLRIGVLQDFTGAMQSMFTEGSKAGKAFAIANQVLASANAVISTYEAAAKALASGPPPWNFIQMVGVITTGLATVAKINAVQFASGKYDVIGASDGRTYSAGYIPQAATGIYPSPTLVGGLGLVGERAPELVVDGPTLSNIQMNAPHIIDAIYHARVPQHAAGNYPDQQAPPTGGQQPPIISQTHEQAAEGLRKQDIIIDLLSNPTRAVVTYTDIKAVEDEINEIKRSVSK